MTNREKLEAFGGEGKGKGEKERDMKPFWMFCLHKGHGFKKGRLYICIDDNNGWNVLVKRNKKWRIEIFHDIGGEIRMPEEELFGYKDRPVLLPVTIKTDDRQKITPVSIPRLGEKPNFIVVNDEKTCLWGGGKCFEI